MTWDSILRGEEQERGRGVFNYYYGSIIGYGIRIWDKNNGERHTVQEVMVPRHIVMDWV